MLPRKLTYLLTTLLIFTCVIKNCASQTALGRFQELPVNCYDCTGSDCVDSFPGRINKCTPDATQSCATVFSPENTVIARGCSGAVTELCNSTLNNCYYCQSSGCNVATTQADYITCLDCDTERDVNCYYDVSLITNTRQCLKSCMTALYPRNKTSENPAYELARACLDDYDLDYREQCESGDLENCVPCSTPSCNTVPKVPDVTRHRCLICEGENCEEPEELECPAYRNPDQCFVQFNEQNDISRMGCMSSLDEEYVLENKRRLYTCDEDLCNIYSPTSNTCAACDSEIDDDCIDSTSGLGSTVCNEFPFTQCATFLKADGNIVRDCLSNILDDDLFDQCLSENNTECQSCTGNTCNVNVFPAERQSCLKCDSATDVSCDNGSLEYASYCTNYKQDDVCVTSVENGLTRRGCQTDFTCNVDDTKSCRTCDSRDCNTIDLLQNDVGEPGKWQDLPLSCYSCDGIECTSTELNLTTCTGNNLQTCMTVFDLNDAIQMRGCSDVVEARYNDFCENNDKCFKCKSNNCNDATAISQFIDCYFCDSSVRKNCAVDFNGGRTRKCKDACMVTLFPSSLTGISAFETQRSCLDDLEKPDQTTCRDGSNDKCSACTSSLCNMEILPADRLECLTCVDDSCQLTVSNKCVSYMENDQCYALFENNSIIDLGCRSNLVADSVELLIKQKKLWVCNENNCNTESNIPQPQSCLVCDSTFDPLCASNPSALTTMETCAETPYTACVTRVTNSGITERGCVSSLSEDEFYDCQTGSDALCQVCTGNDCNAANVFPADRLSCHQCDSSTVENCSDSPQSLAICPIYNAQDTCVTTIENTYTVRGCSSSVQCADENNRASCRICDTPGCNTVNLEANFAQGSPGRWQSLPLTCYACNSSTSCNNLDAMTECSVDISQQCMTVFDSAGAVVQRGCRNSVLDDQSTYCDENTDKCLSCNSNKCNAATALTDYVDCVYCDTERNGNCVNDVADIRTTRKCYGQCMTALYQRANETDPAYGLSRSCLDDLEEEDRQTCIAGQNDNCLACSGTKCNTVDMPEQRLSCLHCEDENCDEPKVRACAQYRNVDQCYIQFDETSSIVRLGCRSDYSNAEADYLLSQKRLLYCDGENCNDLEIVPVAQTCVLCNSRTEEACATNPSRVSGATSCAVLPYTSCYTRTLEDGSTERGCLSSLLDNEFFQCLTNTSDTCSTCSGTSCNSAVYPAERLSCHICDSSTNANCETTPDSLTICPTYDISQTCVSSVRNGITVRGCSADNICDAETSICETCTTVGCNTANVAKKVDDNFGKWQDLPLTCWECSGAECSSATIRENKCSLNNLQDCLTVFDADNNVVRRGCKDQVNAEYGSWCDEHSDKCFNCKSNKCNSATAVSQFVSCVYCDTASDSSCLSNPENITRYRDCQGGCMTALYPRALAADPSYETIRTCLNDKEPADQTTCLAGRDELCATCTTANCNVGKLPQNRLSCYQCYGENCDEPNPSLCPLYNANDQCFTLFDEFNSIAEMGCISSFGNMALEEILSTKRVYVCESENCNSMDNIPSPRQCVECDSSVNPLCATNAYEITSLKTCTALPYTSCYTSITEDGFTLRGCVSDLPDDDFKNCVVNKTESCQVCEQDGCNREIFPEDRLQCYTCNSSEDPSCNDDPSKMELCSNFNSATTCVTALLGTNVTVRGCSWDVLCDSTDRSTCRSCSSSGCNSIKLMGKEEDNYHGVWQDLPLKCYTCEGEQCLNSLGVSTECSGYEKQDCMTVFAEDGSVRRRGCSDEVETVEDRYCRNNPNKCFTCKSNDCNIAWNTTEYIECLFCDSSKDPECETHPANVVFPNRTCYKECMVAVKGESLIRSCLDDKEVSDQNLCKANNNECATCEENNCNDFVFPYKQLSCHVCTDERCSRSRSQPCAESVPNDFCFAKYENNVPVLLGCASTQDPNDLFQLAAQYRLYNCEDNDCNELSKLPVAITCTHCNSTDVCAQNPGQVTEMASCNPLQGQCYSLISNDGKTARGCVSDLDINIEYECVREGTCELCGSSTCNNKIYPADRRRCYICKSETDPNCATSPAQSEVCPIFESNDSCVTRLVNGRTERGCGSDLDCDTNDLASCVMCGSDNCNNVQLQENHHNEEHNSASVARFSLTSIVLGLAVILVLQKQ